MKLTDFVSKDVMELSLKSRKKDEVLRELVDLAGRTGYVKDLDEILEAVIARENLCSTGFENGVAIPHPRQGHPDVVERLVAVFGRSRAGVDFDALDGEPVHIFFLLCAPTDSEHLKALAKLSRFLKKKPVRERLIAAGTPEEVWEVLLEETE